MARFKRKTNLKQVLTIVLVALVVFGAIVGIVKLVDDDHVVLSTAFAKGNLVSGLHQDSDKHIYLKDEIAITNLKVERDFDAKVSYKIVFYDENKEYIAETEALTTNWDIKDHGNDFVASSGQFDGAKYCRIVIEPTADEDGKISAFEVLEYAGQLTITYSK